VAAEDIGALVVRIEANLGNFKNAMNEASAKLQNVSSQAQNSLSPIMSKVGTAFKVVGAAAATGFGALIAGSVKGASSLEQYRNTLNVVMKDQVKAGETMAWAVDFANRTPFETDSIIEATVRLQSYGLEATKVLPSIGDMASVMNKDIMQAVEAVADAQTGELERLKEFGITKAMIVDQGNKIMRGVQLVNDKGQIVDQENFNKALFSLMDERFKGGMETQSNSMKGLWSTVTGTFNTTLATMAGISDTGEIVIGGLFDTIKNKIKGVVDKLSEWQKNGQLQTWADQAAVAISAFWNIASTIFTGIVDAGKLIANNWDLIGPIVAGVVAGFLTFKTIMFVKELITGIKIAMAGLNLVMAANPIALVAIAVGLLVAAGILLYKNWDTIKAKAKELGDKIKDVWENIKAKTSTIWNGIMDFFKKWYPLLLTVTLGPLGLLISYVIGHWEEIKTKTAEIWNGIKSFFSTWWNNLVSWVSSWEIWSYVASAWNSFKTNILDVLTGLASDALTWGQNIVQGLIDGIAGFIGRAVDKAKELAEGVNNAIKNFLGISSPSKVMIEFGEMVSQGLADGIEKRGDKAVEETEKIASAIKNATSKMLSDLDRSLDLAKDQFSLAQLSLGETPSEGSQLSLQLKELEAESATIAERIEVLNEAYRMSVEATGESSDESKQLGYELSKEEIAQKKNQIQIANATKAKGKLSSANVLLQAQMEDLSEDMENLEAKHQIETAMLGESANEASKYALEVRQGNEALTLAKDKLDLVTVAYDNAKTTTGANSEETKTLYRELLQAKLNYEELKSGIVDTTAKMHEQIDTATELKDKIVDLSSVNAGVPSTGRSTSNISAAIANSGDVPTPAEAGLNNTRVGSDGLTDYTRAIRDSLLKTGSIIPKLAAGTNYIPRNMLAYLHKGEAVVPANNNPNNSGASNPLSQIMNFADMFKGAIFHIRNDNDVKLVAREIFNLQTSRARGNGVVYG